MLYKTAFAPIIVIFAALLACASDATAQSRVWRIGWLDFSIPPTAERPSKNLNAFHQGMQGLGYAEGRHYVIEARFADTDRSRLPALAKELVELSVDIIVTIGTPPVRPARNATATIPIVMAGSTNPVELGLIASLARPGGNVTGTTRTPGNLFGKGLQLLKTAAPNISRVAILHHDANAEALRSDGESLQLIVLPHNIAGVQSQREYESILSRILDERADALLVPAEFINTKYYDVLADFTIRNRLPSICQDFYFIERGGLLYYFTDIFDVRRRAAVYVDKILRGAKPADLPVEQPSRFQLIVNMKTAEALGLQLPLSILAAADRIIE